MKWNLVRPVRQSNQQGMVSILVTMILMLVISLIVLGFGQISRREQRESLDQQLSTQAFLAAESGVNAAFHAIQTQTGGSVQEKTQCGPDSDAGSPYSAANMNTDLPADGGDTIGSYTCLLITTQLKDISQAVAADGSAVTVPLHPDSTPIRSLQFSWTQDSTITNTDLNRCTSGSSVPSLGSLPVSGAWGCPYGLLRVDLVPTDSVTRQDLLNNQTTFFLYPSRTGPTSLSYGSAKGAVHTMSCTLNACTVKLTNLPAGNFNYSMRLSAVYVGGTVDITATDTPSGNGGTQLILKDAQVLIDSTGKAQDVLRRVQARVALTSPSGTGTTYALQSGSSICKRFGVSGDQFSITGIKGQDANNPFCKSITVSPPSP